MTSSALRLGTRRSALARWQAEWIASELRRSDIDVELVLITTQGDVKAGPIGAIGTQGVFTKEIQRALLDGEIDLAVHSLKDLPTQPVEGLALAAVPEREAAGDALVARTAETLDELPEGASIGTGSMRRRAQLLHYRPDLAITEIRGNVDTRLRKLDDGQYEAIVLAESGLKRLGLESRISQVIEKEIMLPAVGQGALAVEARAEDDSTRERLAVLDDPQTRAAVLAERAMLFTLRGGCLAPVGAWGRIVDQETLQLDGVVLSHDGRTRLHGLAQALGLS